LAELAHGLTGSLLSLIYLVYTGRVFVAPAMNTVMLDAPATRRNLSLLEEKGDVVLPTGEGILACGEEGHGKLLDVGHIIAYVKTRLALDKAGLAGPGSALGPDPAIGMGPLRGKRVLISLGHTREKWDDVRFLSNRSSGRTGLALSRAFRLAGAEVTVVAGNTDEAVTPGFPAVRAGSSEDIRREMLARQDEADVIIMAAAVADFVPAQTHPGKRKDSKSLGNMELRPFPNVLQEMGARKREGQILVGFALETSDPIAYAQAKMRERNCDLMVVNDPVAADSGFGKGKVMAAVLDGKHAHPLEEWDKDDLAAAVVRAVAGRLGTAARTEA
jgi:phosphopantothenoylcysteine decarboxylase/phosphopantothenate--cysteine ligase